MEAGVPTKSRNVLLTRGGFANVEACRWARKITEEIES